MPGYWDDFQNVSGLDEERRRGIEPISIGYEGYALPYWYPKCMLGPTMFSKLLQLRDAPVSEMQHGAAYQHFISRTVEYSELLLNCLFPPTNDYTF